MSKKTWTLIACLVLSLTLGLGGSLAYLTDSDTKVNTFTMGNVNIEVHEPNGDRYEGLKPGIELDKQAEIKNIGDNPAWVWMSVAIPEKIADVIYPVWEDGVEVSRIDTIEDVNGESYKQYTVRYNSPLNPDNTTGTILKKVGMSTTVDVDPQTGEYYKFVDGNPVKIDYNLGEFEVIVSGYAIQTDGFDSVDAAYEAYNAQWGEQKLTGVVPKITNAAELQEALNNGGEIALANDIELDAYLNVNSDVSVRLDMKGHTIYRPGKATAIYVNNEKADVDIINGTIKTGYGEGVYVQAGKVSIFGVNFEGNNNAIYVQGDNGYVVLHGANFDCTAAEDGGSWPLNRNNSCNGTIVVNHADFWNWNPVDNDNDDPIFVSEDSQVWAHDEGEGNVRYLVRPNDDDVFEREGWGNENSGYTKVWPNP